MESTTASVPWSLLAIVRLIGGRQPAFFSLFNSSIISISIFSLSAPSRSALLIVSRSPISRIPALIAWISSPIPGMTTTMVVSAVFTISTSDWPTPTVSTKIISMPNASISLTASPAFWDKPPRLPRVAMERIKIPESIIRSIMRIRSPKIAPPEYGLVGSIATIPTVLPRLRNSFAILSVRVDLPAPGGPVIPIT